MEIEQYSNLEQFQVICQHIIPERVSLMTNYGDWEDRLVLKGPHLHVSIKDEENEYSTIRISDERGLSVEVPCEGIEIVEIQNTHWDFEAHIYFFTFGGFARLNIIGSPLNNKSEVLRIYSEVITKTIQ